MKRDLKALQRRRLRAARLLEQGLPQTEVARRIGVSRQSVDTWAKKLDTEGTEALKATPLGRPGSFGAVQRRELTRLLKHGALAAGFPTELWTLPRVGALIADRFGHQYSEVHVWRLLRELGFSCQRPTGRAIQRNEPAIREWKQRQWPARKKCVDYYRLAASHIRISCSTGFSYIIAINNAPANTTMTRSAGSGRGRT